METLEGRQSVLAALKARQRKFDVILLRHGMHTEPIQDLLDLAGQLNVPIRYVRNEELEQMTHGSSHGGVAAVASPKPRMSAAELSAALDRVAAPLLLLLEGVDDARNLGFTLRTAEACGATAVLIKKHLWDFDPTEVSRPSSGAYERMPLVQLDDITPLLALKKRGIRLIGCLAGAKRDVFSTDLTGPLIVAIGGEKRGLSGAVREICDQFVTIPTVGGASSLSLSHAAAILLGEALRQRRVA
jgi:23S rRNA (guanosine2251-2'-O)-methyltransferase